MGETTELGVWTNGTDTVVARDAADAAQVLAEHHGGDARDFAGDLRPRGDSSAELGIYQDDELGRGEECSGCDSGLATSRNGHQHGCPVGCPVKTLAQWVAENGRGFLCSTEY